MSLDQTELSLSSDAASAFLFGSGTGSIGRNGLEEVAMEMDKLGVEETKDLLISALFVLKHLDPREWSHGEGGAKGVRRAMEGGVKRFYRSPPLVARVHGL